MILQYSKLSAENDDDPCGFNSMALTAEMFELQPLLGELLDIVGTKARPHLTWLRLPSIPIRKSLGGAAFSAEHTAGNDRPAS